MGYSPLLGMLKKAAVPAPELRQAGQRRSRPLAVLTYSSVRSARPSSCGLAMGNGVPHAGAGRATNTHLFEHSLIFFRLTSVTHVLMKWPNI